MLTKRSLVICLMLVLFVIPITSTAQEQPPVSSLEIAIWPEYDRPAALVIYQVRLVDDIATPAIVTLTIPATAGEPHAVAAWYPDGTLDDNVTWSATRQGDWVLIEVTTITNGIWLEFYDEITTAGDERSYTFSWAGDLAVDSLSFDVMHPVGAVDLHISPEGETRVGSDGLPRTQLILGSHQIGKSTSLELGYNKPTAYAGEPPSSRPNPMLAQFEVALWPEYDQAATLVIYRGSVAPDIPLPTTVSLPIPAIAGDPNAVAILGDDSRLYSTEFERQVEGDWAWVTFETESAAFQLEFYDDLTFDGPRRTYTHFWPGVLNTGSFTYELQQPVGATDLQVTPAGVLQPASDGLSYVRAGLGPQQAGTPLMISFQYEKSSTDLTVDTVTSASTIDRPSTTQGGTPDLTTQLPFILGGFGLALIVLGIFLYLRTQRGEKTNQKQPRQRKRKAKPQPTGSDLDAAAVFCHVCGSKATASDHFCRSCGTKLRQ